MTPTPIHADTSLQGRVIFSIFGSFVGAATHTLPLMLITFLAILLDAVTAWRLSRRVRRAGGKASGKFKSRYFGRVFHTMWLVFSLIYLGGLMQMYPIFGIEFPLSNMIMMAVCFWQMWSILENESSCNDAKWAKFLQRIMIDKTSRHLDVDLNQVIEDIHKDDTHKNE